MQSTVLPPVTRGTAKDILFVLEGDDEIPEDLDSAPTFSLVDPNGIAVSGVQAQPTIKVGLGSYMFPYQSTLTDTLGFYTGTFIGTLGGRQLIGVTTFEVTIT